MTRRRTVSAAAERTLDDWLSQVMKGQLPIQEMPLCVSAWFFAGETYGRAERQHHIDALRQQIRALEHQLDAAYLQAYTPADRREIYQQRLDDHFRQRDAEFFNEPEQLNSNDISIGADIPSVVERRPNDGSTQARGKRAA